MEAAGIELSAHTPENKAVLSSGGAKSGAVAESDPLAAFVASLRADQRAKLLALLTGG
jgi:hypothetical protein